MTRRGELHGRRAAFPVTDDHIHIDPVNGRGIEAAKDFMRSGGTHLFLVTKPSWSHGISAVSGSDFRQVYDETLETAEKVRETGLTVYTILGVHPAEISRLAANMPPEDAAAVMKAGLDLAAAYVDEGRAVAIKSGRPHYPVEEAVWEASNDVLMHALELGAGCGCAVQLHAESGPCTDIVEMAGRAGISPAHVVKHFAVPETLLTPSFIAKEDSNRRLHRLSHTSSAKCDIPHLCREGRYFMLESDYMDENTRPGAVTGPRSVPRFTLKLLEKELITPEDVHRIHTDTPQRTYGVEISL